MKNKVYLSLGSNLGDRQANLQKAIDLLRQTNDIMEVISISAIYQTEPVGGVEQEDFYNCCVKIYTDYTAEQLLDYLHEIEAQLGRQRLIKWGPRTIDLDILLFNQQQINTAKLTIPHQEMPQRLFVLVPLLEIIKTSDIEYQQIKALLAHCPDPNRVEKIKDIRLL